VVVEEAMGMEEMDAALPQVLMMGLVEERVVIPLQVPVMGPKGSRSRGSRLAVVPRSR
jgi:hypothetical protein